MLSVIIFQTPGFFVVVFFVTQIYSSNFFHGKMTKQVLFLYYEQWIILTKTI